MLFKPPPEARETREAKPPSDKREDVRLSKDEVKEWLRLFKDDRRPPTKDR